MRRFFAAVQFLTVIPLPTLCRWREDDLARSLLFFPVVGLLIGGMAGGLACGLGYVLPVWPASVLVVMALIGISRGLHMDGLSDTADAFMSSRSRERMLEIMRDSHIGAMGAIATVCVIALKVSALASVPPQMRWKAALLMPVAGRCALVVSVRVLPYVRSDGGLGSLFYPHRTWAGAVWSLLFVLAIGWAVCDRAGLYAGVASIVGVLLFAAYTARKIGGATGDTLGAACELAETVAALAMCAS